MSWREHLLHNAAGFFAHLGVELLGAAQRSPLGKHRPALAGADSGDEPERTPECPACFCPQCPSLSCPDKPVCPSCSCPACPSHTCECPAAPSVSLSCPAPGADELWLVAGLALFVGFLGGRACGCRRRSAQQASSSSPLSSGSSTPPSDGGVSDTAIEAARARARALYR